MAATTGFFPSMRSLLAVLVALICLGAAATSGAARDRAAKAELVAALMEEMSVARIGTLWKKGLMAPSAIPDCRCGAEGQAKLTSAWTSAVEQGFDSEAITIAFRDALTDGLQLPELSEVLALRRSPLGQKIRAAERREFDLSENEQAYLAALQTAGQALEQNARRKALMESILGGSGGVRSLVDMIINVGVGTAIGAEAATSTGVPRADVGDIVATLEGARSQMERALLPVALGAMALRYGDFSEAELVEVDGWLKRESGRKLITASLAGFNRGMRAQTIAVGRAFAKEWAAERL